MSVINPAIRKNLEIRLLQFKRELLWSYNKENLNSLSNELIISKMLSGGDHEDWNDLKRAFDIASIRNVWENQMLMGGLQFEKQKQLVRYFFNSKNPSQYILNRKRRQLRKSIERSF